MDQQKEKWRKRMRRRQRVRRKLHGRTDRPRLAVHRSLKNFYSQIIDDEKGETLVAANTRMKELRDQFPCGGNRDAAERLGKLLAERALERGVKQVAFDRGSYQFHGRVKAFADAARKAGLEF